MKTFGIRDKKMVSYALIPLDLAWLMVSPSFDFAAEGFGMVKLGFQDCKMIFLRDSRRKLELFLKHPFL